MMLFKFFLLVSSLASPSFARARSPDCVKFVGKDDTLSFESCSDFNIPDGIDFEKVKVFDGHIYNKVENLVAGQFKKLTNLKQAKLQISHIKNIDELAFEGLTKLERLDLFRNSLGKLHENVFKDLVSLKYLNLRDSQVENLPVNIFKYNENLEILWLENNYLTQIPDGLFYPLKKLCFLTLRGNQLEVLHQDVFQENKELAELVLGSNEIKAIAKGTFANLNVLEHIELQENVCINKDYGHPKKDAAKQIKDHAVDFEKCYANYETL
jgi:Leucine-rich repeat (LRR) protein